MRRELALKEVFETARTSALAYLDTWADRRVTPTPEAIAALSQFDTALPDHTGDATAIVAELHRFGSPATVATTGGRFFGLVTGGALPATVGARWLSDTWDQCSALYRLSPINAKLEEVCERWLRDLLGLPEGTVAGFVSGSSSAILSGLAAARYRAFQNLGWDINARGFHQAPPVRIVTGRHTHSTVVKAIAMLGFGTDHIEYVDVDAQGRIVAAKVPPLDRGTILILQAGNVNSGSFDDFEPLCRRAREAGAWIHIDGAFGLWAAAAPRLRHLTKGISLAHSWSVDGHKTLNTPYDSGIVLCQDRAALVAALQATGSYITYSEQRDGMLYTPEMSRRARAIELWAALKYLGRQGVADLVEGLHDRAVQMAAELRAAGFEVLNDIVFNQVLIACGTDTITARTITEIQQSGECWAGGATWHGRPVIRVSVCSWMTTAEDVSRSVRAFAQARDIARAAGV